MPRPDATKTGPSRRPAAPARTNLFAVLPRWYARTAVAEISSRQPSGRRPPARSAGARLRQRTHWLHVRWCCNSFSLALGWRDRSELWSLATSSGCPSCGWDAPMPRPRSFRVRSTRRAPPRFGWLVLMLQWCDPTAVPRPHRWRPRQSTGALRRSHFRAIGNLGPIERQSDGSAKAGMVLPPRTPRIVDAAPQDVARPWHPAPEAGLDPLPRWHDARALSDRDFDPGRAYRHAPGCLPQGTTEVALPTSTAAEPRPIAIGVSTQARRRRTRG